VTLRLDVISMKVRFSLVQSRLGVVVSITFVPSAGSWWFWSPVGKITD